MQALEDTTIDLGFAKDLELDETLQSLGMKEGETLDAREKSGKVQDPKLRSNSFYGRRNTLIKCVKKFRQDFPECDALVFGNWRLQVQVNRA